MKQISQKMITRSLLNNQILGAFLIVSYFLVYGITAQVILSGLQLMYFLFSLLCALSVIYIRETELRKNKAHECILFNQIIGTTLIFAYILGFGVTSFSILNGFQLIFFMSSYTFAMSIFYIRDPDRIKVYDPASYSGTDATFSEKNPCFINSKDLSWLVRELNGSLCTVIGFSELMLSRKYSENEREFMLRNIYERAVLLSYTLNKVSAMIPDSLTKPKEIYEVVDLLADNNFK